MLELDFAVKPFDDFWEPLEIEGWRVGTCGAEAPVDGIPDFTPFLDPPCPAGSLGAYPPGGLFAGAERASYTAYLRYVTNEMGTRTLLDTLPGACDPAYSTLYHAEKRLGPLRLGATYEYSTAQDRWRLRYALFADERTHAKLTLAGHVVDDETPYSSPTEVGLGTTLTFTLPRQGNDDSRYPPTPTNVVKVASLMANGVSVPLAGIAGQWIVTGSEVAEAPLVVLGGDQANAFGAPITFRHDVDVRDAGGGQTGATVALTALNVAGVGTHTETVLSPSTGEHALSTSSWAGIDTDGRILASITSYPKSAPTDPDLSAEDMRLRFSRILPKTPGDAPAQWQPMTVQILAPNPVLRSTNDWTGSGPITISGGDFSVSGAGATATRTLNSKWRNWNDSADPAYHADDDHTTTKADYYGDGNQDTWGWSLYSFLDVEMTCSVDAALTLTLTVAVISPGGGVTTFTRSYDAAFAPGTSTQRIDLLFPQEADSAPCYIERVDAIQLSGFAAGDYTVGALALVADQPARVKVAARGGWSGLLVSQDGSFPASQWGTDPAIDPLAVPVVHRKADEDGLMRTDSGDDFYGGCVRMDGTLAATCVEWNRMEGVTCSYDGAAMEADLVDGDGNQIGFLDGAAVPAVPQATWLHDQLPALAVPANTLTRFPASPPVDTLALCPMPPGTFTAVVRGTLGMALEAVVATDAGKRAPAGRPVQAKRQVGGSPADTDPVLGSGTTDAAGYCEVSIRSGTYGGAEGTVYLTGG